MRPVRPGPFGAACSEPLVSSSRIPLRSVRRPPLSMASGRDSNSVVTFGPSRDDALPGSAGLEDVLVSERSRLLRYLERRVGKDAAPDMVQEVFLRAVGSEQSRRLMNPAAFLQRIARNLLIDRARKRARDAVVVFAFEDQSQTACPAQQEWDIEAADLLRLYEAALEGLPAKTRRVFQLHRVEELSYHEIHKTLGISVATVEYHMMKALAHIARCVDAAR